MKKNYLLGLTVLFLILFIVGCTQPGPTIGPAQLTITNGSSFGIQDAYFNGTYFGSISTGSSVTKDITSGNYYLYIQMIGIWMKVDPSLRINAGESPTITILDTTIVAVVSGPGASLKAQSVQSLQDVMNAGSGAF